MDVWTDKWCVVRLGTLDMDVPEFVDLVQNAEEKTATLSVRDPNAKEQKEMWGTFLNRYPCYFKLSSHFFGNILNPVPAPLTFGLTKARLLFFQEPHGPTSATTSPASPKATQPSSASSASATAPASSSAAQRSSTPAKSSSASSLASRTRSRWESPRASR